MRRRLAVGVGLLLLVAAAGRALATAGSQAAPPPLKKERAIHVPTPEAGPAPLAEAATTIQRTFVSTSGNDLNPCTRAEPCRNFATAIANTQAHEQLTQLADEQAALRRVATLVAEGATPQSVFDTVRRAVARMQAHSQVPPHRFIRALPKWQ